MKIFIVEMLRNDSREEHSYVEGVYSTEYESIKSAWLHIKMRANKYGAEITGFEVDKSSPTFYRRHISAYSWDEFCLTNKEWSETIKKEMDNE